MNWIKNLLNPEPKPTSQEEYFRGEMNRFLGDNNRLLAENSRLKEELQYFKDEAENYREMFNDLLSIKS